MASRRNRSLVYCPYSDADVPAKDTSLEHIIPLALGGHDRLVIPVHKDRNSNLGSEIDGGLAKEFVVARRRAIDDVRGHSGRVPTMTMKKAKEKGTGRPLQLRWGKRLEVYDVRAGSHRRDALSFDVTFNLDIDIRLRFLAKAFLSAGYLAYGDLFRSAVEHREPRLIMRGPRSLSDAEKASLRTRAFYWFNSDLPPFQREEFEVQNAICSLVKGSLLVFTPGPRNLGIFGSVLGVYLGMLNVPADTTRFPREGDHDLGHAMIVSEGRVLRWSYRRLLGRLLPEIEKVEASRSD